MTPTVACPPELIERTRLQPPAAAIVLGSGLGSIVERIQPVLELRFDDCPPMHSTAIDGHAGRIILGDWNRTRVLLFAGRNHFYEGHAWDCVLAPIRLAVRLHVERLLLTNAAGGIRDDLAPGTLMAITQHLDWTRPRPWTGQMNPIPYSLALRARVRSAAHTSGITLRQGSYAAMLGPNYETPAEIRALRALSVDSVGMSTAREVLAAHELGLECAAVSCITNRAAGLSDQRLSHLEVLEMSRRQAERLGDLLEAVVGGLERNQPTSTSAD
jgi:purine-nucleoside phosphorylase